MRSEGRLSEHRETSEDGEEVVVRGAKRRRFGDLYHRFLRASWAEALASIVCVFLAINAVFAAIYTLTGGVAGARPGSFFDGRHALPRGESDRAHAGVSVSGVAGQ
jgi:hypothetical protein